MHIMLIAPGVSIHSQRFLHMLLDIGHTVTLVDSYNPVPEGVERYSFVNYPGMFGLERLGLRVINRWLGPWIVAAKLRLIWRWIMPDIVHVHWVDQRAYQCVLAKLHPLILTCWGSDINNLFEGKNIDHLQRQNTAYALSKGNHITADTSEILERCEILTGEKKSTSLFYFGINLENFRPDIPVSKIDSLRARFNIPTNAKTILSIRRLVAMMGHHHILKAFATVIDKTDLNIVLLLHHYLDKDSDYENELRRLAARLGVEEQIIWLEGVTDEQMPALYSLADVIVNFPDYDGLPVSLFEAAACKKPIITNNLRAYKEILENGAFTVVPPGDLAHLAMAIERVLNTSNEQIDQQLEKNYEMISQVADQQKCIRQMEQVYLQLAEETPHV